MDFTNMTIEQLMERRSAIAVELDAPEADLDALEAEVRAINDEIENRRQAEQRKTDLRAAVANGAGETIEKPVMEENKMTLTEIRSSAEYIDAYARYIKTGRDDECRSLLTENVSGAVPVPVLVDEIVRTAWNNDQILSRVRRTFFRGNLKVAFERSATAAALHTEGTTGPSEESLVLGIVTMIPKNIKKWIRISDEAVAMGGEAFLRYVYDELTYQIIKKLAGEIITAIKSASATHSSSAVGVPQVTAAPGLATVATAMGNLSDEAVNNVVIMNRLTWGAFKTAQYGANFAADPFEGLPVLFSDALPAYATADSNAVYAIVGDLAGAQVNYPEGDGVVIKYDELTESEDDMVKVVGRQYCAYAVTAPGRFVNILKPAAET